MAVRKITPERREQRKKLLELLQGAGINDVAGVQELFKEMVGTVLENGLGVLGEFCVNRNSSQGKNMICRA
jgi:hypothetical protein